MSTNFITYDFRVNKGNFQDLNPGGCGGDVYVTGSGWQGCYYTGGPQFWDLRMEKAVVSPSQITRTTILYSVGIAPYRLGQCFNGDLFHDDFSAPAGTLQLYDSDLHGGSFGNVGQGDSVGFDVQGDLNDSSASARVTVHAITFYYTGDNPFLDHYCSACDASYVGADMDEF